MNRLNQNTVQLISELTDAAISRELNTSRIGHGIRAFRCLKSTNEFLFNLAEEGVQEGTICIAEEQSMGRGRFGRDWHSPPGVGIWCSVLFRPDLAPWEAPKMTMVSSLAVIEGIEAETGLKSVMKWPNDILLQGRKVCGILTELNAEVDRVNFVIVGIGLNVNQRPEDFPEELRDIATSLLIESGRKTSRLVLLCRILGDLEKRYDMMLKDGFQAIQRDIKARSSVIGRTVSVRQKNRVYRGKALDIDEQGRLVVEAGPNHVERLISGDVRIMED